MVKLVDYSDSIGRRIIGVTINYRVGLFGFLASEAIANDLKADGLAGIGMDAVIPVLQALQLGEC